MNWKTRLNQYDYSALQDLSNAGLLRRATKLCESGKVTLNRENDDSGEFCVGSNNVKLFADFPQRTNCDCKAAGLCVHILAAVLHTQQSSTQDTETTTSDQVKEKGKDEQQSQEPLSQAPIHEFTEKQTQELTQELQDICQQDIFKWAGKTGCRQAEKILLANNHQQPQWIFDAKSVEIVFDDEIRCRYVAGGGLPGIICAAPESRRKGVIAACLLAWRQTNGEEIAWPTDTTNKVTTLSSSDKQLLKEIKTLLDNLLHAGLMHSTTHHIQSLRTLAWSARGESFPQLSATVLHLAGAMVEFQQRSAKIDTHYLLDVISSLWLQCNRILNADQQQLPALKGRARRDYNPRDVGKLWVLGASQYSTISGAKGVSLVTWDIEHNKPYRINIGRTAGSAHSLNTHSVWEITMPWEKGCSVQRLAGQVITLSKAKASDDNRLSLSKDTILSAVEDVDQHASQLQALGLTLWSGLTPMFESAIAQSTVQLDPVFIQPDKVYEFVIDEYEQQWTGWAQDTQGKLIKISLPVNAINNERVKRLNKVINRYAKNIWAMVLEPTLNAAEVKLSPVSVVFRDKDSWLCFSPDFEFFQQMKISGILATWVSKLVTSYQLDTTKLAHFETSTIESLFRQINDFIFGAVELGLDCKVSNSEATKEIASELQIANSSFLANIFEQLCSQLTTDSLLNAYYCFSLACRRLYLERMTHKISS